jgi:DinB superfamily
MEDRTLEAKQKLIYQLDEARDTLLAVLANLDTQTEIYPSWKLKDLLAHLSGWDEATIASLQTHIGGGEPLTPAARGIDFYNAESVATRGVLSYEQVAKELKVTRDQLKATILDIPADKFEQPLVYAWGPSGSVAKLVAVFVHHEKAHAKEIQRLFKK